ncbi:3-ketoacyl-ACP reductase [Gibbsiella dentisursi]|uniref:3-ketoacyl-ACP reductase n=1 Tax=Gibbsiella dentisursi TaxID=796890 RepID=A0ABP7LPB4_9GAMM
MHNATTTTFNRHPRPVAIVTGGLQGLGLATAKQLDSDGFDIAIIDLHPENRLGEEAAQFIADGRGRHRYYMLDIAELGQHTAVLAQIVNDYGRLDCLVNNAGIAARPLTDLLELTPEAFDRSVAINLRGTFFLTQRAAKLMLAQKAVDAADYRAIIFITSIAAGMVSTDRSQYCTTKAALSMVSKLFAIKLAPHGIHVHEIRPGFMRTPMTASLGRTAVDEWIESGRVPLSRWGEASDIARAIGTLARGQLPYMTGEALYISGGVDIPQAT